MMLYYKDADMRAMFNSKVYKIIKDFIKSDRSVNQKEFHIIVPINHHHVCIKLMRQIMELEDSKSVSVWSFSYEEALIIEILMKNMK